FARSENELVCRHSAHSTARLVLAAPVQGQRLGRRQVPDTSPVECAAGERIAIYAAISSRPPQHGTRVATSSAGCTPSTRSQHHRMLSAVAPCRCVRYFTRLEPK